MISERSHLKYCRLKEERKEEKSDNLAGAGKPLNLEPMPADEGARMMWWMLRIMKNNDFTPHEVVWRKTIDRLKDELSEAREEAHVVKLVGQINELVRKVNTLGTNALKTAIVNVSLEVALARFRQRMTAPL